MAAALRALPVHSCSIDGELVGDDEDRIGNLWLLHRALGAGREDLASVMAFDLLREGNEDLRALALSARKMRLEALLERAKIPGLS